LVFIQLKINYLKRHQMYLLTFDGVFYFKKT